jgi:short-subunit dehydrogenase
VLAGRRRDVLERLAERVDGEAHEVDLTDRDALLRLAEVDVDAFVSNAALPGTGALFDYGLDELDRALDVNLRAPLVLTRILAERMRAAGRGHVAFVASVASRSPTAWSSLYCATKFGLRGFALSLRQDLHGTGVGVSIVMPGMVRDAGMFAEAGVEPPRGAGTSSPEEVAAAVVDAIERDRGEVTVAPLGVRLNTELSAVAPELAAALGRRVGSDRFLQALAEGQRPKR